MMRSMVPGYIPIGEGDKMKGEDKGENERASYTSDKMNPDEEMLKEIYERIVENTEPIDDFIKIMNEEYLNVIKEPGSKRSCAVTTAIGCYVLKKEGSEINFEYFKKGTEQLFGNVKRLV